MQTCKLAGAVFIACFLSSSTCQAQSEFRLPFHALERILTAQAFTSDGRLYLRGASDTACSYAYLQDPKVSAEKGKLKMHVHFSGRSAVHLLGKCLGFGDTFEMTVLSTPFYRDGSLRLRDVSARCEANSVYARAACLSVARSVERNFRHDLRASAQKMLDGAYIDTAALYKPEIESFQVTGIRVTADALVLLLQVGLALK